MNRFLISGVNSKDGYGVKMSEYNQEINIRKDYKNCENKAFLKFVAAIEKSGEFTVRSYTPAKENSHYERYAYQYGEDKLSVVYDVKAKIISITAKKDAVNRLDAIFTGGIKPASASTSKTTPKITDAPPVKLKLSEKLLQKKESKEGLGAVKLKAEVLKGKKQPDKKTAGKQTLPSVSDKPRSAAKEKGAAVVKQSDNKEQNSGFSVKNFTKEQFDGVFKAIRKLKGISTKTVTELASTPGELTSVEIAGFGNKVYLRFMPQKKSLSVQGKRSQLYLDVQMLLSGSPKYKSEAVSLVSESGEEQKAALIEKKLKKLIPNAFDYLSEQSKTGLSIGLADIYNDKTKLSDYSVLLVPPFRALERFIFDLQTAQGIDVKMIGQGFEKNDKGEYCIKSGYRKKIDSVVFNEVLSALYTLYFFERHSFTHSDNTDSANARVIQSLKEARAKFDELLFIIDYNAKKLKEIRFSTK